MKNLCLLILIMLSMAVVAQDKTDLQGSSYHHWIKVSLGEIGLGYGSAYKDIVDADELSSGVHGKVDLMNFAMGFNKLGGLGIGTKVFTYNGLPKTEVNSWFPLYAYYPVFISKKFKPSWNNRWHNIASMLNLYAGGSLWCSNRSYLSEKAILADKYYHFGLNYMFYNLYSADDIYLNSNFSINAGLLLYDIEGIGMRKAFNVSVICTIGGFAYTTHRQ